MEFNIFYKRRVFIDKKTGRVYEEGDVMKRERFAELVWNV